MRGEGGEGMGKEGKRKRWMGEGMWLEGSPAMV